MYAPIPHVTRAGTRLARPSSPLWHRFCRVMLPVCSSIRLRTIISHRPFPSPPPPTSSPRTLLDIARDVTSGRFKDSNGRLLICSIFFIFSLSLSYSFDSNYLNIKETRRHNTVFLFFLFFTETETRIRLNISLYREKINSTPFYSCDFHIARGNIFTTRFGRDCLEFRYKLHSSLNLSRMIRFKAVAG